MVPNYHYYLPVKVPVLQRGSIQRVIFSCSYFSFFTFPKNLLNQTKPSNQVELSSPQLYDTEIVTFTSTISSHPPFPPLDYWVSTHQSLLDLKKKNVVSRYSCIICSCPLLFNIFFFFPRYFISFSLCLTPLLLHLPLYSSPPPLYFSLTAVKNFSPCLFMINQGSERWHSVGGISRGPDEISGAHLLALYGDLLGWDKQQASHHSQPNRLPACMCLFLLHCHDHCRRQGWSSLRGPALR